MRTALGEFGVLDAHVHFFSSGFFDSLRQQGAAGLESLGWELPAADPLALAARWVAELDRHGVERAALIASVHGDEASVQAAVAAHPDRFFAWVMLNPVAADARQRLERSRPHAVCLFPAMHRYSLHDDRVRWVFEFAAQSGMAVFTHCGVLSVGVRKRLGLASPFDMRFSNPLDLHALALAFPQVPFIVPHFGAGYFREALMLADLCPNVYLDTSSSNSWMRYEGLDLTGVFRRALSVAGPGRLLFGTDSSFFPRGWQRQVFEDQAAALAACGATADDARLIFGGNLSRLLTIVSRT